MVVPVVEPTVEPTVEPVVGAVAAGMSVAEYFSGLVGEGGSDEAGEDEDKSFLLILCLRPVGDKIAEDAIELEITSDSRGICAHV